MQIVAIGERLREFWASTTRPGTISGAEKSKKRAKQDTYHNDYGDNKLWSM